MKNTRALVKKILADNTEEFRNFIEEH